MIALALLLSAAPQQVPVDMILNGDFERELEHLGNPHLTIFGSYWIGAEGTDPGTSHVQNVVSDGGSGHVLRIGSQTEHVIVQRVPLPMRRLLQGDESCGTGSQPEESDVTLAFDVRGDSGSAAYVSVIAESGYHTSFHWKATPGTYVSALASDPRMTAWGPLQEILDLINDVECHDMAATDPESTNLYSQEGTSNSYSHWVTQIEGGMALQAIWTAPYTGIVRVYDRPAPFVETQGILAGAEQSFLHEIFYVPTGDTCSLIGPISSLVVSDSATDKDGVLVVKRLDVTKGDRIVFRISNNAVSDPGDIKIQWHPALRYETYCVDDDADGDCDDPNEIQGRRVTYYTGTAPAARLGETLVQIATTTSSTFTTFGNLKPLQLSGDPLGLPHGALDIELGSFDTTKNVEFDDVSCLVEFDDVADEDELREQLLTDVTRSRDNERFVRDRPLPSPFSACGNSVTVPGGANIETPFVCHQLHIDNGPLTPFTDGARPSVAAGRQGVAFDLQDYLDLDYIGEAVGQRAMEGVMFLDPDEPYDCQNDTWGAGPDEVSLNIDQHLDRYMKLGDVDELRHALALCFLASQEGVVMFSGDPRVGTILGKGYSKIDGSNQYINGNKARLDAMSDEWLFMALPSTMVRTYVECARYITANGNPGGFLDEDAMEDIWDAAAVAAAKGAELKHYWEGATIGGEWEGTWLFLAAYFNDRWGYGAGASWAAVHALDSIPTGWPQHTPATSVDAMTQIFYEDFILDGGEHFLDLWEHNTCRYAAGPADQFRAWLSYAELYDYIDPQTPLALQLRDVLHEAAINVLKFQYPGSAPGSVWYNGSLDAFQQVELIGSYATAAYGPQIALTGGAVALHALTGTQRDEMLDCMATVARVTNAHFGREFGHQLGIAPLFSLGVTTPTEGRALTGETDIIKALNTTGSELATVGILLADLQSTSPATVQFKVRETQNSLSIQDVVNDHCSIVVWSYDTLGDWTVTDLWSGPGGGGTLTPVFSGNTATFIYNNSLSGDVKFRIATWTPEGKWTAKTSYQEW